MITFFPIVERYSVSAHMDGRLRELSDDGRNPEECRPSMD
jgi:hypothetical protein